MASSASKGTTSSISSSTANSFYTSFRTSIQTLENQISCAITSHDVHNALQTYARLNAQFTTAVDTGVLALHDQALHKRSLDQVVTALESKRKHIHQQQVQNDANQNINNNNNNNNNHRIKKGAFTFKRKSHSISSPNSISTSSQSTDLNSNQSLHNLLSTNNSNHLIISNQHNITYNHHNKLSKSSISLTIHNVTNSIVHLDQLEILSVQLGSIQNSIIKLPCVQGSIMINDLNHSILLLESCHQFRMHTSFAVVVIGLTTNHLSSVVTLEASNSVQFVTNVPSRRIRRAPVAQEEVKHDFKVQDFDDLINSEQLQKQIKQDQTSKDSSGARARNFSIIHLDPKEVHIKQQVDDELLKAKHGLSAIDCVQNITQIIQTYSMKQLPT
ncbi:uncharacterized protein MEPE_01491 [Melanopsichium pennsylvanicum]|uniref:C-CAP/cofactor C-like domain-containing protein n=1 Tax=Melanopsichium pennsylvanicum TaxID=63383 RepID=A0AAJ5C3N3_9BASI|nr:uncharacterized protein MEPE_01491 [Melanopsichium pennsylvanicum]